MHKFPGHLRNIFPVVLLAAGMSATATAQITKVVNAASLVSNTSLAPGSIITIFGTNLASGIAVTPSALHPPNTLGGASVTVGGASAGMFYVSPMQINAVMSATTPVGMQTLTVNTGTTSFSTTVTIDNSAPPGIFSLVGTGTHDGAIINAVTFALGSFSVVTGKGPTFLAIFATGLNLSVTPTVTVGGVPVTVQFFGNAPCCQGLEQINVMLPDSLSGAGRVEVVVMSGAQVSNTVEIVLVPKQGQGPFQNDQDNETRSRELASIASIPGTSLALVTDENDDVVRVVDAVQRKVTNTIVLPAGAQPVGVAVNATGKLAVVAERNRGKVSIIDLTTFMATGEVATGLGPVSVAIAGNDAVVVNGDADSVTIVDIVAKTVLKTLTVGRGPHGVAADATAMKAYVTNEDDGTVSVIDIAGLTVSGTIALEANLRVAAIALIPGTNFAAITVPSAGNKGQALILNLTTGKFTTINVNPDQSGGSSEIAVKGNTIFFANQTGGSVSTVTIDMTTGVPTAPATTIKVDLGARALAVDAKDNFLLVTNEGSGTVVVIDLATGKVLAHIDAVRSQGEEGNGDDDHGDRDHGKNLPVISSLAPVTAKSTSTFTITIMGTNLTGATDVIFVNPTNGDDGHGHSTEDGPHRDAAFTASNIQVNSAGTQLTATITVKSAAIGPRVVLVDTPNGDSSLALTVANTLTVTP
jgi:uncharacterized protein (TIGR03437 family)